MSTRNNRLVIVRAGADSTHPGWIDPGKPRRFDLLVSAYSEAAPRVDGDGVRHIHVPGWKVRGLKETFDREPHIFENYSAIALIDDDIFTSQSDIDICFDIGNQFSLKIWQPSLTWDSYFSHACFLRDKSFKLRYVNFIEMMCPFFSSSYLKELIPLFELGYETGIDLVWTRFMDDPWMKAAIVDAISVQHTKKVGAQKHLQGFRYDERYDEQMLQMARSFNTKHVGGISYAAVDYRDQIISSRLRIAFSSIMMLGAIKVSPMTVRACLKLISAYTRHTITRPLDLSRVGNRRVELAQ